MSTPRQLRIAALAVGLSAVAMAALGTLVHWATWIRPGGERLDPLLAAPANALRAAALPGWLTLMLATDSPAREGSLRHAAAAQGISWALYGAVAFALVLLLARMLRSARPGEFRPDRRRAIIAAACCAGGAVPLAGAARATVVDPWRLTLRRYRVPIRGLPGAFDGLRIAQLSDTHLCPRTPAAFISEAVELALAQSPDLVALTGDYISRSSVYAGPSADLFRPIASSRIPMVGVLGNHDWWHNGVRMSAALRSVGVRMIDNDRVFLTPGRELIDDPRGGDALCLAGLGDLQTDRTDPDAALRAVPDAMPRIVLAHEPDSALSEPVLRSIRSHAGRFDLMLSGHTHGGQVSLPLVGPVFTASRYGERFAGGVCEGPGFPVVVSRGVGTSVLPVRFGVPPEVVLIELARA